MALESLPKIAPALFSAEQDLIQIYNKKTDTTGVINASLLGGSTPPSGVSGAIQFSNGSAFASDAANLFWDNVNKRLGVGTNTPVSDVTINSATGNPTITLQKAGVSKGSFYEDNGGTKLQGSGNGLWLGANSRQDMVFTWDGNNYTQSTTFTFGANSSLGARVGIKGSGSTSATTSLLVQNSAGTQGLKIDDNSGFQIGSMAAAGQGQGIRTDSGGGGINAGINTNFNNGATWNDDANVCALKIAYNNGIRIANTTRYPLTLGSDTKAVASAQLEMVSTTQGFLPPRMTDAQIRAIASPANGLIAYNTTTDHLCVYQGGAWVRINHSPM